MNELRMYVEYLFQGKVLTPETIELKEEIYGNLVARYEDLVSSGMADDEALRRTKESITSVDDVLNDAGGPQGAGDASGVAASQAADGVQATGARGAAGDAVGESAPQRDADRTGAAAAPSADTAATTVMAARATVSGCAGAPEGSESASAAQGGPVPPEGAPGSPAPAEGAPGPRERKKIWPWVCGGCALLVLVGVLLFSAMLGFAGDLLGTFGFSASDGEGSVSVGADGFHAQRGDQSVDITPDEGVSVRNGESDITIDADGTVRIEGEVGDELLTAVVNSGYADVAPYVGTSISDASGIETFLRALPLGQWVANLDVTAGRDMLKFDYCLVPESYDGDSVDAALAYNATALFCAIPEVTKLRVTVTESDDAADRDCYVFTRADAEQLYGMALSGDLVNEEGWDRIKGDKLYRHDFAECMVDAAERDGR